VRPGVVATLLAALLWGTSFPAIDLGLAHVHPLAFAALRFALALAVLLALAAAVGRMRPGLFASRRVIVLGLLVAGSFLSQFLAQTLTTPGKTALFVNLSVFPIAALAYAMYGEALGRRLGPAVALAGVGAVLVATGGRLETLHGGTLAGDALALASGLFWAFFAVGAKPLFAREGAIETIVPVFAWALAVLAPVAVASGAPAPAGLAAWAAVGYVGFLCTAAAFALWAHGMPAVGAAASAVMLVAEIVVALAISLALGLERLSPATALGAGLVLAGVGLASLTGSRTADSRP